MLAGTFSMLDLDLDLAFWKRTWTRTWTCPLKVDLDLDLRIVDLDLHLDLAVGLVTILPSTDTAGPAGTAVFSNTTCYCYAASVIYQDLPGATMSHCPRWPNRAESFNLKKPESIVLSTSPRQHSEGPCDALTLGDVKIQI